jgi:hypothetical protein
MNAENFKKIMGKTMQYVTDGVYEFPAVVVTAMHAVHCWYDMGHACKLSKGTIDIYIAIAGNAGYFKTDGQSICTQAFFHNTTTGECWLDHCFCHFSLKDAKKALREYKKRYDMNAAAFMTKYAPEADRMKKEYPWQICITVDKKCMTQQQYNKSLELVKA